MGEETLTDLLLLEMLPFERANGFRIRSTTKSEEGKWGADLLLVIRRRPGHIHLFAIQAKKIDPGGVYKALNYQLRGGRRQIDVLEAFARLFRAQPFYLLYNHGNHSNPSYTWTCCKTEEVEQIGCTLVPSSRIREAIRHRGYRTFNAIHRDTHWRPWRCAFDCPDAERQLAGIAFPHISARVLRPLGSGNTYGSIGHRLWRIDADLPDEWFDIESPVSTNLVDQLRMLVNDIPVDSRREAPEDDEKVLYPSRLLLIDYVDEAASPDT